MNLISTYFIQVHVLHNLGQFTQFKKKNPLPISSPLKTDNVYRV